MVSDAGINRRSGDQEKSVHKIKTKRLLIS